MSKELPDPKLLRKLLRYDPDTGKLFWRIRTEEIAPARQSLKTWNSRYANREAFTSVDAYGYKVGNIQKIQYKAHRVIFAMHCLCWPYGEIDHVNGNRADNKIENLREVSREQNQRNVKLKSTNTTGNCVVGWDKRLGKWSARIGHGKTFRGLGYFEKKGDAIAARKQAETEMGYHSNHGRTTCPTAKGKTQ